MLKEKTGRVTFMPLNRLKPKNPPIPNDGDAIPLLDKLQFDALHLKAFQQVFGKTCVCRDLSVAAAYVRSHGINTITLDGDKVDRKGALTGGYHDVRRSRIEAIKNVTTWKAKWEDENKRLKEVKKTILELDQSITKIAGKISINTAKQGQIRDSRERLLNEGNMMMKEKTALAERIAKLIKDLEELETEKQVLKAKVEGYKMELNTPMVQGLTSEEEALIETLGKEVEKRKKDVLELGKKTTKVSHIRVLRRHFTELHESWRVKRIPLTSS
jgi:structural maintenance of chromosome 3 (chondroitin sulfate proteoglycan 6)